MTYLASRTPLIPRAYACLVNGTPSNNGHYNKCMYYVYVLCFMSYVKFLYVSYELCLCLCVRFSLLGIRLIPFLFICAGK